VKTRSAPASKSGDENNRASADLAKAKAELRRFKEAVARARRESEQVRASVEKSRRDAELRANHELASSKAEVRRVTDEAAAARHASEQLRVNVAKSRRDNKFRLRVAAVIMLMAALIKIAWVSAQSPPAPPSLAVPLPPLAAASVPIVNPAAASEGLIPPANLQLSRALNRLSDAFHSFPEEHQMDVVREINQKHPGDALACPMAWSEGEPALYVGDKKGEVPPSVVGTLNQCASEVEKLRAERGSAERRF
jgi:hypothetical protein